MRGQRNPQSTMLAFVSLEERVPPDHPLRIINRIADAVLDHMSGDFDRMYSKIGRASVPPERLLKARFRRWMQNSSPYLLEHSRVSHMAIDQRSLSASCVAAN